MAPLLAYFSDQQSVFVAIAHSGLCFILGLLFISIMTMNLKKMQSLVGKWFIFSCFFILIFPVLSAGVYLLMTYYLQSITIQERLYFFIMEIFLVGFVAFIFFYKKLSPKDSFYH